VLLLSQLQLKRGDTVGVGALKAPLFDQSIPKWKRNPQAADGESIPFVVSLRVSEH